MSRSLTALMLMSMIFFSTVTSAAPKMPLDNFVSKVADQTGKTEEELRDKSIEVLRETGKFSAADLARIGRGESLDINMQREMIYLLRNSEKFSVYAGITALRNNAIQKRAKDAFDGMRQDSYLVVNCSAPQFEGEMRIYKNLNTNQYTVNYSGVQDYNTKKLSAGPGGLHMEYIDSSGTKRVFVVEPGAPGSRVEGYESLSSNLNNILIEFTCVYAAR